MIGKGIAGFAKGEAPTGMTPGDVIAAPTWATSAEAKAGALYDRADSLIDQSAQIPLPNTLDALRGPMGRFPSSEKLGSLLTNQRLKSYADAIDDAGGTLTVPETRQLRTYIGSMMRDGGLRGDTPLGDLKSAYGALTEDLRTNAAAESPEALQAFDRATQYYRASGARLEKLETLLGASPEQTFAKVNAAAGQGKSANAGLLQSLQRSMLPDEWGDVGSTVLRQLGEPTASSKDVVSASGFSPSSLATNWNKLSNSAQDSLFGENLPGSNREALDALVRVAGAQKNVAALSNVSHSGELVVGGAGVLKLIEHPELITKPGLLLGVAAGVLGARKTAQYLMSPGFARWLYGLPSVAQGVQPGVAAQRALAGFNFTMQGKDDPAVDVLRRTLF